MATEAAESAVGPVPSDEAGIRAAPEEGASGAACSPPAPDGPGAAVCPEAAAPAAPDPASSEAADVDVPAAAPPSGGPEEVFASAVSGVSDEGAAPASRTVPLAGAEPEMARSDDRDGEAGLAAVAAGPGMPPAPAVAAARTAGSSVWEASGGAFWSRRGLGRGPAMWSWAARSASPKGVAPPGASGEPGPPSWASPAGAGTGIEGKEAITPLLLAPG
ncbi:MAG TPA: hypothetical protein VFH50_06765 [Acidimicrobiales bacterium]|nr:hypothetical protein [Acidimicrobiales bacterium]